MVMNLLGFTPGDLIGFQKDDNDMKVPTWIKRLGFWGFLFFLVKGLLWLIVPALLAFWAAS